MARALEVSGLVKAFGDRRVLDHLDLEASQGEIVGLLGPNGAGKTTLVSIVCGLVRPDAGTVQVGGIDAVADARRARRLIGFAPQETAVYPTLTCWQNLRFFGELAGLHGARLAAEVDQVIHALALAGLADRRAGDLSGGERRRLHSAIALVHRPPLVLLDEPTTGADVGTRAALLQFVREVASEGSAVVYSTHYLAEIEQLGASVVILDHGRLVARGSARELIAAHSTSVIELTFSGAPPQLDAPVGSTIETDGPTMRVRTRDVSPAAASLLSQLGDDVSALRAFEIVRPSLETVFMDLTGRRYAAVPADLDDVA